MKLDSLSDWIRTVLPPLKNPTLKTKPEILEVLPSSNYQSSSATISGEAQNQIALNQQKLTWDLAHPEPKVLEKLSQVNQKRLAKGQAAIDLPFVTQRLEAIQKDSSLSDKQKKEKVEALRKELGLSKGEMKALFTKRIEAAYKQAEKRLAAFEKAKSDQLQSELKQTEASYGVDSAQAKTVRDKLDSLKSTLEPERQRLKTEAKFFGSLYPGFFSRLGGVLKKIGQGLSKVLGVLSQVVRFIPALGPLVSSAFRSVQALLQGKLGQFGKGLLSILGSAKNLLPMIPGVGTLASFAVSGIEAVLKATRGTKPL